MSQVRILATCRKKELLDYTLFVFRSIRVGFPTSKIQVTGNALPEFAIGPVSEACSASDCEFENGPETIHHKFIARLLDEESEPFVLCDTDIWFFNKVEDWVFETALAGFRVPEFSDEFTGAITRSRLHSSLLFINPESVRKEVGKYDAKFPSTPFNPPANLIYPICLPLNGNTYFYDSLSLLYHAIGGTAFNNQQKDSLFHFHFGTISDLVLPRLSYNMEPFRKAVLENPELGRGAWRQQEAYYSYHRPVFDGLDVVTPVKPDEAAKAREWNYELCRGNEEAMSFGELWYGYVHAIDDLIDTMQDGRPRMSKEQIISVFFCAALLYNHSFYLKNQRLLFPVILDTTNIYKMSVEWESSPKPHLRAIGDVLRSCGLKMHSMIALICGGEEHMFDITKRLYEKDYLGQHDCIGNPI